MAPTESQADSRTRIYHDGSYLASHADWHVADSPWKARQVLKMLRRQNLAPTSICEVGCGAGEILRRLGDELPASTCTGFDISPDLEPFWAERRSDRLSFQQADILTRPDAAGYDLLMVIDLIEHVEDYFALLRGLRPRATHKLFHIPLDMNALGVARGWPIRRARARAGHIHYFNKDTALASLRDTGYEIEDWFYTASVLELGLGRTLKGTPLRLTRRLAGRVHEGLAARLLGGFSLMVLAK